MILVNYGHLLGDEHIATVERITGERLERVIEVRTQFDNASSFSEQVACLIQETGLEPTAWQTTPIVVNLPGHSVIAAAVLAELHGRVGHFPAVLRWRLIQSIAAPLFEIAEVINLQQIRDCARAQR